MNNYLLEFEFESESHIGYYFPIIMRAKNVGVASLFFESITIAITENNIVKKQHLTRRFPPMILNDYLKYNYVENNVLPRMHSKVTMLNIHWVYQNELPNLELHHNKTLFSNYYSTNDINLTSHVSHLPIYRKQIDDNIKDVNLHIHVVIPNNIKITLHPNIDCVKQMQCLIPNFTFDDITIQNIQCFYLHYI